MNEIIDPSSIAKLPAGTRMLFGQVGDTVDQLKLLQHADGVGATGQSGGFIECTRLIDQQKKFMADLAEGPEKAFTFLDDPSDLNQVAFCQAAENRETVLIRIEFPNTRGAEMVVVLSGWEIAELNKGEPMKAVVNGKQNSITRFILPPVPVITLDPKDVSVAASGDATFTADATGSISQKWQARKLPADWADIGSETAKSLTLSGVASGDTGKQVRCVFTNAAGDSVTTHATLTVQ